MQPTTNYTPWVRSSDGVFAGVCEGIAKRFEVPAWAVRVLWLLSILGLGFGFLAYIILALCLPREDQPGLAHEKKFLGVCLKASKKFDMDVGLLRSIVCFIAFSSLGTVFIVYVIMFFMLSDEKSSTETIDVTSSRTT